MNNILINDYSLLIYANMERVRQTIEIPTEIWEKVVEKIPEATLDIVGDGSERENLVGIVNELKLKRNVNFLGYREDIPQLFGNSNFSVLTSSNEGLPVAIAESFLQKRTD